MLIFKISQAQIQKGSMSLSIGIGGSLGGFKDEIYSSTDYTINFQPIFEYFIKKNLSMGVIGNGSFRLRRNGIKWTPTLMGISEDYIQNYALGFQCKKYFVLNGKMLFTLSPQYTANYYESNRRDYNYYNPSQTSRNFNANYWFHSALLNIGALYFVKSKIALEVQTNFLTYSFWPASSNFRETNSFSVLAFQNNTTFGIKYIFGGKAE